MSWASAWRLAVGTLTVFPVRPPAHRPAGGRTSDAAGAGGGAPAGGAGRGRRPAGELDGWPGLLSGLVVVGVLALGTRALHLDGLADTVDRLGSGRDPERALEIMRRGDIGPMGVLGLILVVGAQASVASTLVGSWSDALLLVIMIAASRSSLVIACRPSVPAARPGGLGRWWRARSPCPPGSPVAWRPHWW